MDVKPWERQPDEPSMWFWRFDELFRPLGPERSLLAAYNGWRNRSEIKRNKATGAPISWHKQAKNWDWQRRAEAWDAHEAEKRHAEEEELRLKRRDERRALIQGVVGKLAEAIKFFDPKSADARQIVAMCEFVLEQSRKEYDDEPAQRHEHSGPGGGDIPVRLAGDYLDLWVRTDRERE